MNKAKKDIENAKTTEELTKILDGLPEVVILILQRIIGEKFKELKIRDSHKIGGKKNA